MSYHTNTSTSIQNVPGNVLLAPKNLLNRLMPGRYPVEEVAVINDMLGCSDLSYYLSKLAFETYDGNTPRGFSTDLAEMITSLLRSRGHKIKKMLSLYRHNRVKISFITNGGAATPAYPGPEKVWAALGGLSHSSQPPVPVVAVNTHDTWRSYSVNISEV